MAEYTPSEARVCIDYCNAAVARRFSMCDPGVGMARADAEFDRFIEAVKRDAAREALDGFTRAEIDQAPDNPVNAYEDQEPLTYRELAQATAWRAIGWLDTHYPEHED